MNNAPVRGLGNKMRKGKREEAEDKRKDVEKVLIRDFKLFRNIKPRTRFVFHSDYFKIDDAHATILTIMHHQGADDSLEFFWGINLVPRNLGNDVVVRLINHVGRMSDSWVAQHQVRAEGLMNNKAGEVEQDGSYTSKQKFSKEQAQLIDIAQDLMNGSSYLRVAMRLYVKAPTLEELDEAVEKISRQYKDRFDTVFVAPYIGEQRKELSSMFGKVEDKLGRNFMFTSAEYAGNYNLVTRGIEDPNGEYVGQMEGDVNNSAVLMDVDDYESHVVIAGGMRGQTLGLSNADLSGQRGVDVWGAKLGMSALLRNRKVVHLVLNRSSVSDIGVDLSDITSNVNMTQGDINPFEMFGDKEDSLSIFPAHVEKIVLMVEQLQKMPDATRARIVGALREALNNFYVDKRMWVRNAQENRSALRVVGIPHIQVPRLPEFQAYLDMEYTAQVKSKSKDPEMMNAYGFLKTAFKDMMDSNGDLFNTTTSDIIDRATISNRVIYDFSSLLRRGRGLMMAQFVNALGFAVGSLEEGDVLMLHGVDELAPDVKTYVRDQLDQLQSNDVRVVFIYSSVDNMIDDRAFNRFEGADYTLLGGMSRSAIDKYETTLRQEVPLLLKKLLEHKEPYRYYLRRGFDNVVFASDLQLGIRSGER